MNYFSNKLSRGFGKIANRKFSRPVQSFINKTYVSIFKIDMSEFKKPNEFLTLNQLFTRSLNQPRKIDETENSFISPTDSVITEFGKVENSTAMQIKGKEYDIRELLTSHVSDEVFAEKLENGTYVNFYLSPRDYHHFHIPTDVKITKLIHVSGALCPVNYPALNRTEQLFNKNERVVLECLTPENQTYYYVLVGALNVGQILFSFEPDFHTNIKNSQGITLKEYENLTLKKGDDVGHFAMGSTVVIIAEKDFLTLDEKITLKTKVSFGEKIGTVNKK